MKEFVFPTPEEINAIENADEYCNTLWKRQNKQRITDAKKTLRDKYQSEITRALANIARKVVQRNAEGKTSCIYNILGSRGGLDMKVETGDGNSCKILAANDTPSILTHAFASVLAEEIGPRGYTVTIKTDDWAWDTNVEISWDCAGNSD